MQTGGERTTAKLPGQTDVTSEGNIKNLELALDAILGALETASSAEGAGDLDRGSGAREAGVSKVRQNSHTEVVVPVKVEL